MMPYQHRLTYLINEQEPDWSAIMQSRIFRCKMKDLSKFNAKATLDWQDWLVDSNIKWLNIIYYNLVKSMFYKNKNRFVKQLKYNLLNYNNNNLIIYISCIFLTFLFYFTDLQRHVNLGFDFKFLKSSEVLSNLIRWFHMVQRELKSIFL